MATRGSLILFSAPSGCGKTTLVNRLLQKHPDWIRSISVTTRSPRPEEKDKQDYFFVSHEEFEKMRSQGNLLECAQVFQFFYGTPKEFILKHLKENKTVVLAIDIQGMKQVKRAMQSMFSMLTIFVLPPSIKILKERLEGRKTETPEVIQRRLDVAQEEIKEANLYDRTVVNQDLEETVVEIDEMIKKFQKERR